MPNRKRSAKLRRKPRSGRSKQMLPEMTFDVKMPSPRLFPPGRAQLIQMRGVTKITTDSSGLIKTYIPFDPSLTLSATYLSAAAIFSEWASWKTLYNEVKLVQFDVRFLPVYTYDGKVEQVSPLAMSSTTGSTKTAPTNYGTVMDNGDAQQWAYYFDTSGKSRFHSVRFKIAAYATVDQPDGGSSSGIAAGCPGMLQLYAESGPVSANIAVASYTGTYLLRTRI